MSQVSVVIPVYNKQAYISRAIKSVLAQGFGDFEIVVVDDGSTDDSVRQVESFEDSRITLIRQANCGAAAARNTGIAKAKGEWVAFLDADDEWPADKLALQLRGLRAHPDIVWSTGAFVRKRNGRVIVGPEKLDKKWFDDKDVISDALVPLANGRHIWTGTVMVKRSILLEMGGFDTALSTGEDLDLWFRIAVRYPRVVYIRECLADYNVGLEDSLTASGIAFRSPDSVCVLARRVMSSSTTLCPVRARYANKYARCLMLVRLNILVWSGNFRLAKQVLGTLDWIDLGLKGRLLWLKARVRLLVYLHPRYIIRRIRHIVGFDIARWCTRFCMKR